MLPKDKRVVLYGAGAMGRACYTQLKNSRFCRVLTWVDGQHQKYAKEGMQVESPDGIFQNPFLCYGRED